MWETSHTNLNESDCLTCEESHKSNIFFFSKQKKSRIDTCQAEMKAQNTTFENSGERLDGQQYYWAKATQLAISDTSDL